MKAKTAEKPVKSKTAPAPQAPKRIVIALPKNYRWNGEGYDIR